MKTPKPNAYQAFDWLDGDPDFTRNVLITLGKDLWGDQFYRELGYALLDQIKCRHELKDLSLFYEKVACALLDHVSHEHELAVVRHIRKELEKQNDHD